jgi:uncharacterized protein (TIGR02266 family)
MVFFAGFLYPFAPSPKAPNFGALNPCLGYKLLDFLHCKLFKTMTNDIERSLLMSEETKNAIGKSFMERVIFEATIKYKSLPEINLSGLSSNLSAGGLYLRTKLPLEVDDTLSLSFALPGEVSISCAARVAWTNFDIKRRKPDYATGVGLQFLNLSSEDSSTLEKFIDTYEEEKRMNVVCAWCGSSLGQRKGPFGKTSHGVCEQCRESLIE